MAAELITKQDLDEIGVLVKELRHTVEGKSDQAKVDRINVKLDTFEEKNAKTLEQVAELKNVQGELKDLKEFLASGKAAAEEKELESTKRMGELEAELAKRESKGNKSEDDWHDSADYKAFNRYCQVGEDRLEEEHKALLRSDSDVDGGFMTTEELDTQMIKKIEEISPFRSLARTRTMGQASLRMVVRNTIPEAFYEGEAEEDQEGQSDYGSEEMFSYRLGVTVPVTKELLMDSNWNMDSEIMTDASLAFAQKEGRLFITGTGSKQPEGFLTNTDVLANFRNFNSGGDISSDQFLLVQGDLKFGYNPSFVLNRRTLAVARTLKGTSNDHYLWDPALNGPAAMEIAGSPYTLMIDMPDIAVDAFPVAFGDWFRAYTIVDRTSMTVIRDDLTRKRKAIVEFTFLRWNNGQTVLAEAIRLLKVIT